MNGKSLRAIIIGTTLAAIAGACAGTQTRKTEEILTRKGPCLFYESANGRQYSATLDCNGFKDGQIISISETCTLISNDSIEEKRAYCRDQFQRSLND